MLSTPTKRNCSITLPGNCNKWKAFGSSGRQKKKASVVSFLVDGFHPYDLGTILDKLGIAVRTGHHCTQPLMERFCIPGTVRASLAFYNNRTDIDRLVEG